MGVVLLFALFGLLALVVVRAAPRGSDFEKKRAETRAKKLDDAQKEYLPALTTYGWVDKAKGVARIPVTDAMKLTLAELAQKKPAAAGPIAPETPPATSAAPAGPAPFTGPGTSPSASAPPAADGAKPTPGAGGHESEQQPAAASSPPPAPPNTQPGAGFTPSAAAPPAAAKPQSSPSPSPAASAPGTPLPVRGKTP